MATKKREENIDEVTGEVGLDNMGIWKRLCSPPATALKTIGGGRLKGMTDINPQWRIQAMTEVFGPCGIGWKYVIKRLWIDKVANEEVLAFSEIDLFIKEDGAWSEPIPGIGGSSMVSKEKNGLFASDECFKMATTDALSVAMKMIGVAADVYAGMLDSKYQQHIQAENAKKEAEAEAKRVEEEQYTLLSAELDKCSSPADIEEWIAQKRASGIIIKKNVKLRIAKKMEDMKEVFNNATE